jgi:AbrB family looped-hinge helix DNA binding protein
MGKYAIEEKIIALSRVYQRGKTQVPKEVRDILGIEDGDKVLWLFESGKLIVRKAD